MSEHTLSLTTEALLAISPNHDLPEPLSPLDLALLIGRLTTTDPFIRRAVRDAEVALTETGFDITQPGQAELLALAKAAKTLLDAAAAMLDAAFDANDFLHGEGLPGICI